MMINDDNAEQRSADDKMAVDLIRRAMAGKALRPPQMPNKKLVSIVVSETAREGLRAVASELGYVHGGHGNISMLMEALGLGTIHVVPTLPS